VHITIGVNAIINIIEEDISEASATLVCTLACSSSTRLLCTIVNTTAPAPASSVGNYTPDNYSTQLLIFNELSSGTSYNYCIVAINTTDMMEVGHPVCGDFTTENESAIKGTII